MNAVDAWPKTRRGRRSLALDERTVTILEAHRRGQLEERIAIGLGRPAPEALIFTDPLGEPVKPDSLLPEVRPHGREAWTAEDPTARPASRSRNDDAGERRQPEDGLRAAAVRYRRSDVEAWLAQQEKRGGTS